jgi:hypothetical protein
MSDKDDDDDDDNRISKDEHDTRLENVLFRLEKIRKKRLCKEEAKGRNLEEIDDMMEKRLEER